MSNLCYLFNESKNLNKNQSANKLTQNSYMYYIM
jgi:hypothetical protein